MTQMHSLPHLLRLGGGACANVSANGKTKTKAKAKAKTVKAKREPVKTEQQSIQQQSTRPRRAGSIRSYKRDSWD